VLPALFADRAWCRSQMGDLAGARADVAQAEQRIDPAIDNDDRALAHGRLAQVFSALGDADAAREHEHHALDALARHRRDQARVLAAFANLLKARAPGGAVRTAPC
jgi:Tfp pilus assembly protein PilF